MLLKTLSTWRAPLSNQEGDKLRRQLQEQGGKDEDGKIPTPVAKVEVDGRPYAECGAPHRE